MPPVKNTGSITAKLKKLSGVADAVEEHKNDETKVSNSGNLPKDVTGVAKLVMAKIDEHKDGTHKGKLFLLLQGVVVEPKKYEGIRTSKMHRLYDYNNTTVADSVGKILNEFRKLGVDTSSMTVDDIEATLAVLEEEKPFFKFNTWSPEPEKGKPAPENPMVFTNYNGLAIGYEGTESPSGMVEDNTGVTEEQVDLVALAEKADANDTDAQEQIDALAKEAGIDSSDYTTWADVVEALQSGGGEPNDGNDGNGDGDPEPDDEWVPAVSDVYNYKPKGKPKAVECEVTAVNGNKLTLKESKSKTIHKNIPWSYEDGVSKIGGQEVS